MSTMRGEQPSLTLYNPAILGRDDLVAQFVLRTDLLERLLQSLRSADGITAPQHHLITGPRGMGKTTALLRVRYAIEEDAELGKRFFPLNFPEEQYDVRELATFWRNALDALADALDQHGRTDEARALDALAAETDDLQHGRRCDALLRILLDWASSQSRILVLFLDNFDQILGRLSEKEHWTLRKTLAECPRLLVIAASTIPPGETYEYSKAFYDFFQHHTLEPVSIDDARRYMLRLAEIRDAPGVAAALREHPERLQALQILTGGSPRALATLFLVLVEQDDLSAAGALERVLDVVTPYYKHIVESLAERQQIVVDALAKHWDPATANELHKRTRLPVTEINSNLKRLEYAGIVAKMSPTGKGRYLYYLSERLLNIWYLMRASRRVRERLLWLVRFLEILYGPTEMRLRAQRWAQPDADEVRENAASIALAYSEAMRKYEPVLSRALELSAADILARTGEGLVAEEQSSFRSDTELVGEIERKRAIEGLRAACSDSSAFAGKSRSEVENALFGVALALGATPDSIRTLTSAISHGLAPVLDIPTFSPQELEEFGLPPSQISAVRNAALHGEAYLGADSNTLLAASRRWNAPDLAAWVLSGELAVSPALLRIPNRDAGDSLKVLESASDARVLRIATLGLATHYEDSTLSEALREHADLGTANENLISPLLSACRQRNRPLSHRTLVAALLHALRATPSWPDAAVDRALSAILHHAALAGPASASSILEELNLEAEFRPVTELLRLLRSGTRDGLSKLAPEIRTPVTELLSLWDDAQKEARRIVAARQVDA